MLFAHRLGQLPMAMGMYTRERVLAKTFAWRIIATLTGAAVAGLLTGEIETAGWFIVIEFPLKMGFYYFHERFWEAVDLGSRRVACSSIAASSLLEGGVPPLVVLERLVGIDLQSPPASLLTFGQHPLMGSCTAAVPPPSWYRLPGTHPGNYHRPNPRSRPRWSDYHRRR